MPKNKKGRKAKPQTDIKSIKNDDFKSLYPNLKWILNAKKNFDTGNTDSYKSKLMNFLWLALNNADNADIKNEVYILNSSQLYFMAAKKSIFNSQEKFIDFSNHILRSILDIVKQIFLKSNLEIKEYSSSFFITEKKFAFLEISTKTDEKLLHSQLNFLLYLLRNIFHFSDNSLKFPLVMFQKFFEIILSIDISKSHKLSENIINVLVNVTNTLYSFLYSFKKDLLPLVDPLIIVLTYQLEYTSKWNSVNVTKSQLKLINYRISLFRCLSEILNNFNGACFEEMFNLMSRILYQLTNDIELITKCSLKEIVIKLEDDQRVDSDTETQQKNLYLVILEFVQNLFAYNRHIVYNPAENLKENKVYKLNLIEVNRLSVVILVVLKRLYHEVPYGLYFNQPQFTPISNKELFDESCLSLFAKSIVAIGLDSLDNNQIKSLCLKFLNSLANHDNPVLRKTGIECIDKVKLCLFPCYLNGRQVLKNFEDYLQDFSCDFSSKMNEKNETRDSFSQTSHTSQKTVHVQTEEKLPPCSKIAALKRPNPDQTLENDEQNLAVKDDSKSSKKKKIAQENSNPSSILQKKDDEIDDILKQFNPNFL